MTHTTRIKSRERIRKKIVELLKGKTDAGDRVFPNRAAPAKVDKLPIILVYSKSDAASKFSESPREYKRTISMVVEIIAAGPEQNFADEDGKTSVEDLLDALGEQVECEISRDIFLQGEADDLDLGDSELEFEARGQKMIGSLRITFDIVYYRFFPTDSFDKQGVKDDLKRIHVDWYVGHDNDSPDLKNKEAEDDLEIPTT